MNASQSLSNYQTITDLEIKRMQDKLKCILLAIHKVCEEHNLRYYLIAGTMLGAIRHKGFIPWDDDADIGMPRVDYEIFLKHANEWLPKEYELIYGGINNKYPYPFARVQDTQTTYILRRNFCYIGGIPVDVFPLDGMTSNRVKRKLHYLKYRFYVKILYYTLINPQKHGRGAYYVFVTMCNTLFDPSKLHKTINRIQQEFNYEKSDLVADHDNIPSRGILPKNIYGNPSDITFEKEKLRGVAQPDKYLRYCYGNYMEIPPVSKRPKRNFRYMNPETPYIEILSQLNK